MQGKSMLKITDFIAHIRSELNKNDDIEINYEDNRRKHGISVHLQQECLYDLERNKEIIIMPREPGKKFLCIKKNEIQKTS